MISSGTAENVTIDTIPGPFNDHPTLANQLLAAYRCQDNEANSVVLDATPNANHGSMVFAIGVPLWIPQNTNVVSNPNGKLSPCFELVPGRNAVDYGVLEGIPGEYFEIDKPWSLAAWVSSAGFILNDAVFCNRQTSAATPGYKVFYNTVTSLIEFHLYDGAGGELAISSVTDPALFGPSTWFHLGVTYDGSATEFGMDIYLNSAREFAPHALAPPPVTIASSRHHFGSEYDAITSYWNGRIQQGLMWSRTVTPSEFVDLYNGGNGLAY